MVIPRDVAKQLLRIPRQDGERLLSALEDVAADLTFRQSFVTEVVGRPGLWRLRKGVWRAFYRIEGDDVLVQWAGPKREAERWLR